MPALKSRIKKMALRTMKSAGIFALATRFRRRDKLVILCYHGISLRDEHEWEGGLYITPALFRERLKTLRRWRANVLPLGEAIERLHAGTLPPRSVVITFDDGFYDFYVHAWPLLREFGFPATLYLTTYYSAHRLPIFNLMVSYLLWRGGGVEYRSPVARSGEVVRLMELAAAEGLDVAGKDLLARRLAESFGIDYDEILGERLFQIMTPQEAEAVAHGGIDLQLHTHRHRTPHDRDLFVREIRDNETRIAEASGRIPHHFCYPSGVTSPDFLPWLRECGVVSATTCEHGLASPTSDPLMLPRYLDGSGVDALDFESWLSGMR